MKYRAKCTNCVSHIKNITKYADADIHSDKNELWIEVDSAEEAVAIDMTDYHFGMALLRYKQLIELTLK